MFYYFSRYPFDTQNCNISFTVAGSVKKLIDLREGRLDYLGPVDLTQYFVKLIAMNEISSVNEVIVTVVLGRKVLNEVLLTYVPTVMIMGIVYLTSFFKTAYFEAILTVNLTCKLEKYICPILYILFLCVILI